MSATKTITKSRVMTSDEIKNIVVATITPMLERDRVQQSNMETQMQFMNDRFNQVFDLIKLTMEQMNKRFEDMQHNMDKRFDSMDKRFEDMQHNMDKRFEAVDKRFEDLNKRINFQTWVVGIGLALSMGLMTFLSLSV